MIPADPARQSIPGAPGDADAFTRTAALLSCAVAGALGAATLAGWAFDLRTLRGATPTWLGMAPTTAVSLLGLGGALWCAVSLGRADPRAAPRRRGPRVAAGVAGALAALALGGSALVEWWLALPPTWVDLLFFAGSVQRPGEAVPAGRMAPTTATGILLLGVAVIGLVALAAPIRSRRRDAARALGHVVTAAATLAAVIGFLAGVVHLYGGQREFRQYALNPMAFNTAIAITVLAVGVLMARSGVGLAAMFTGSDAGAVMARQLAPVAVLVPIVIGSLRIVVEQEGLLSPTSAAAARALTEIVIVLLLVLRTAERLRALDLARNAERRRLSLILDRLPVGVVVTDAEGAVVHQNPVSTELLGAPLTSLYGALGAPAVGTSFHDDGTPYRDGEYPITRALLERRPVVRETLPYERADGTRLTLSVSATPVFDAEGALTYVVAAIEDVSEREAARAAAVEANAAKSQFLTNMSHELRTPLNAIGGHVQLVELGIHGPVTDAQRGALARVQRAQHHLLALITDVLSYARLEAGRVEFVPRPLPACAVVRELTTMIEPQVAAKGLTLRGPEDNDDSALLVLADHDRLVQTILNLLSNAIKFTPSVQPSGAPGAITIEVAPSPDGGFVDIAVSDTGVGIPADRLDAIFDPFVQAHADLTRVFDGAGLGLAISRDLARGMGGDLRVTSVVGAGSTFTLSLPRAAIAAPPAAPLATTASA